MKKNVIKKLKKYSELTKMPERQLKHLWYKTPHNKRQQLSKLIDTELSDLETSK